MIASFLFNFIRFQGIYDVEVYTELVEVLRINFSTYYAKRPHSRAAFVARLGLEPRLF